MFPKAYSLGYDYAHGDSDPFPSYFVFGSPFPLRYTHGTLVAGIITAAKDNGVCGVGGAYDATLTGISICMHTHTQRYMNLQVIWNHSCIRYLHAYIMIGVYINAGINLFGYEDITMSMDIAEGGALSHNNDVIDIYSNSWGPIVTGIVAHGPDLLARMAFEMGVKEVRTHVAFPKMEKCP